MLKVCVLSAELFGLGGVDTASYARGVWKDTITIVHG